MHRSGFVSVAGCLVGVAMLGLVAACASSNPGASTAPAGANTSQATATPTKQAAAQNAPTATPAPDLRPLKVAPDVVTVGTPLTLSADGLPPSKPVEFVWMTMEGRYDTKVDLGSIEFLRPKYAQKKATLGKASTDAKGSVTATVSVPAEDYGELHDIYAVVDGRQVARGGVYVQRTVTISPLQGPVGTPITIDITGLGSSDFQSTAGVRWDNGYVGFMSSATTDGSARATIRAAGPPGQHVIDIGPASAAVPFLNPQQTPRKIKIPTFHFVFNVTGDGGAPPPSLEWPDPSRVSTTPTLPLSPSKPPLSGSKVLAQVSPSSGPILSKPVVKVTGLSAGSTVDLVWMTVTGSDVTGWLGADQSLGKATAGPDGAISTTVEIPEGLGGWHTLMLVQDGAMVAQAPYFVERSLVGVNPPKVKAGEKFTVEIKGVGWTELDNGVAVLYDNSYVGYACGFGSGGDVTVEFTATGGPGTHIVDLYPMIYNRGFSLKNLWDFQVPDLTFSRDHPGLGAGYKLPAFHLAVEVVP